MAKYVLMVAAIAIVALVGYELPGRNLGDNVSRADSAITAS